MIILVSLIKALPKMILCSWIKCMFTGIYLRCITKRANLVTKKNYK